MLAGGSDQAGFVQFMTGRVTDRARLSELDEAFVAVAGEIRPDVIGGVRAWTSADTYVDAIYFTSEAEAREAETREMPAALQEQFAEMGTLVADMEYLDITDPWLSSP